MSRVLTEPLDNQPNTIIVWPPIDLVHLAKQTLGNPPLEREVLRLFLTQASLYLKRLRTASSVKERSDAAHTIKGSARNVGAWHIAQIAERLEVAARGNVETDILGLETALCQARHFISSILEENDFKLDLRAKPAN